MITANVDVALSSRQTSLQVPCNMLNAVVRSCRGKGCGKAIWLWASVHIATYLCFLLGSSRTLECMETREEGKEKLSTAPEVPV